MGGEVKNTLDSLNLHAYPVLLAAYAVIAMVVFSTVAITASYAGTFANNL
jgi:hypothetical protein